MQNQTIKELFRVYSHLPLGLLVFKEKELFFINQRLRETVMLGSMDNANAIKVICSTLGIESTQDELLSFLSSNEFFHHKEKHIQISSNSVDNFDIFVFTRVSELLLEDLNVNQEIAFIPISSDDSITNSSNTKEHAKLLKYFDKKRNSTIITHSIYKGVPLIANSRILRVYKNTLVLKLEDKQMIAAAKNMPWILKISSDINIKGTVVHEMLSKNDTEKVRLGHPGGIMDIEAKVEKKEHVYYFKEAIVNRTARRLMEGYICVPEKHFKKKIKSEKRLSY